MGKFLKNFYRRINKNARPPDGHKKTAQFVGFTIISLHCLSNQSFSAVKKCHNAYYIIHNIQIIFLNRIAYHRQIHLHFLEVHMKKH